MDYSLQPEIQGLGMSKLQAFHTSSSFTSSQLQRPPPQPAGTSNIYRSSVCTTKRAIAGLITLNARNMAPKSVTLLKFVGSISLGLLTGLSYTLSAVTLPALLTLPSASSASLTFTHLTTRALTDLRIWAGVSTSSFLLAYVLSPRGARHPYLLWTPLLVAGSGLADLVLRPERARTIAAARQARKQEDRKKKKKGGKMEASYEVLGDSHSEGTSASDEGDEDVNGEELRTAMEGFRLSQMVRLALAGTGFLMSLVGIWGDGA